MEIKITKVAIQTFCGLKDRVVEFGDRTIIKGVNKAGKTTIMNAIYWVLFNKLADGSNADDKVRPHDEDGVNIDYVDVSASVCAKFDGKEVMATKTQKQNWVKDRTTQEQKFKGNVNEYEINGIPKKEKDFTDYINQFIDSEKFMFCINPKIFFNMDTKKRRAMLFSLVGNFTDADVIATDPKFEPLKNELMDGTVDELIARAKKAISAFKEQLKTIPARIDELSHQIVDVDVETLNANKDALVNLLNAEQSRIADIDKANAEYNKVVIDIAEIERNLDALTVTAEREFKSSTDNLNWEIQQKKQENARINSFINANEKTIADLKARIESNLKEIDRLRESWEKENSVKFDADSQICPTCGAKYSASKVSNLEKIFAKHKAETLKSLTDLANGLKKANMELEDKVNDLTTDNSKLKKQINDNEVAIEALQEKVNKSKPTDVSKTKEYKELIKKRAEMEERKSSMECHDKGLIMNSINEINSQINAIDIQLSQIELNKKTMARIEELGEEQKKISQDIATQEMALDLLTEYNRTKIGMLTDKINAYFNVIKWQMFKEQINGGFAEVCIPLVEGTSYDGLLNHGNKLLAEIDLCKAFQKANDVTCPIIIDDSESLDSWRIPNIDSQLIILRRTDDAELTIKNEVI